VAVVGESGCGKSVMLRAILGLLDPKRSIVEGRIAFDGRDLGTDPNAAMRRDLRGRRVTMIFQDPSAALNPVFTIGEQLVEVMARKRRTGRSEALEQAREGLRQVAIEEPDRVLASYPFQLSGGMNQRVMITMALVNRPDLVLADEPGTALDVTVQNQTLRLMRRLTTESGAAVMLITHNLGVVREFAERVYVMYAGAIVEEAPVRELFASPKHPYTQALLAAVPRLSGAELPKPIAGMIPDFMDPPPGCRFHPRCPFAQERCRQPPPRIAVGAGHSVACVLYAPEKAEAA
jgi:peptide/nickel transport system ATP-binding protein